MPSAFCINNWSRYLVQLCVLSSSSVRHLLSWNGTAFLKLYRYGAILRNQSWQCGYNHRFSPLNIKICFICISWRMRSVKHEYNWYRGLASVQKCGNLAITWLISDKKSDKKYWRAFTSVHKLHHNKISSTNTGQQHLCNCFLSEQYG